MGAWEVLIRFNEVSAADNRCLGPVMNAWFTFQLVSSEKQNSLRLAFEKVSQPGKAMPKQIYLSATSTQKFKGSGQNDGERSAFLVGRNNFSKLWLIRLYFPPNIPRIFPGYSQDTCDFTNQQIVCFKPSVNGTRLKLFVEKTDYL